MISEIWFVENNCFVMFRLYIIRYNLSQPVSACLSLSQLGQMICDSFGILMLMSDIFHIVNHKNEYIDIFPWLDEFETGLERQSKKQSRERLANNIK